MDRNTDFYVANWMPNANLLRVDTYTIGDLIDYISQLEAKKQSATPLTAYFEHEPKLRDARKALIDLEEGNLSMSKHPPTCGYLAMSTSKKSAIEAALSQDRTLEEQHAKQPLPDSDGLSPASSGV